MHLLILHKENVIFLKVYNTFPPFQLDTLVCCNGRYLQDYLFHFHLNANLDEHTPHILCIPSFIDKIWVETGRRSKHHAVILIIQGTGMVGWETLGDTCTSVCVWECDKDKREWLCGDTAQVWQDFLAQCWKPGKRTELTLEVMHPCSGTVVHGASMGDCLHSTLFLQNGCTAHR